MIVERLKDLGPAVNTRASSAGKHNLDHQNWVNADHVKASFDISHDGSCIYLKYFVEEDHIRAINTEFNSAVWEDSCVEFFFSLAGDEENYYNFEFNAIGTILGAYGKDRNNRKWLPSSLLQEIEVNPSLGREAIDKMGASLFWSLELKIPIQLFCFNELEDLSGKDAFGNFYKCGDKLKQAHFLSWKPIINPTPDFHLPRYFGQLSFS